VQQKKKKMKKNSIIVSIILPIFLLLNFAHAGRILTKSEFTQAFYKKLVAEITDAKFEIKSELTVYSNDLNGNKITISLDNAYISYSSGEKDLATAIATQVESIKDMKAASGQTDIETILPVIKPRDYIDAVKQQTKIYDEKDLRFPMYYEKLNNDLYVLFVYDSEKSMRFVTPDDVKKQKLTSKLRKIAASNLITYFKKLPLQYEQLDTKGVGEIYILVADKNYEASTLLINEFIESIPIKGEAVVFAPARNMVLLAGAADKDGVKLAKVLAQQGYDQLAYPISPYGYINKGGKWVRFEN